MGIRVFNSEYTGSILSSGTREVTYDFPDGTGWETDGGNLVVWAEDSIVAEFRSSKWDRVENYAEV